MQTIFDMATAGVMAQGMPSLGSTSCGATICMYRGNGGMKCAIGHVLSDDQMAKYNIAEDSNPYVFPSELLNELLPGHDENTQKTFLAELQSAHDEAMRSNFIGSFTERVNKVAKGFDLNPIAKQEET